MLVHQPDRELTASVLTLTRALACSSISTSDMFYQPDMVIRCVINSLVASHSVRILSKVMVNWVPGALCPGLTSSTLISA